MAGIDVLASFGIGAAELDAYERADPPRPARGSLGRRAKDRAAKSCQAGVCGSCIDAPGLGKLCNSLPEGLQRQGEDPEEGCCGLSNFERLRKRTFLIFAKSDPRK